MPTYVLGVDIGTSACKAALFDSSGRQVALASAGCSVCRPNSGWAQQNPDDWRYAASRAIKQVTEQIDARDIACVGVDGQSWACVLIDAHGRPLADSPIWMDTRAKAECDEIDRLGGALFQLCGNPTQPTYTLPKLLWFRNNMPDLFARAASVMQSNSYVVYGLTGRITQDVSQGYGYQCFDIRRCRWDEDALRALLIPAGMLPEVVECDEIVGGITAAAARETGLLAGTPVVAGGLDAACGALGTGVIEVGQTHEYGGTSGGMSICADGFTADPRLIFCRHVVPDRWLLQGGTVGAGGALRWLRDVLCPELSFDDMTALAAQAPPGSDGLIFLPYLAGERSPIWDPEARGVFDGLDYSKTRAHLIRAVLEGVAYSLKHNLDVAAEAGARPAELRAMGGGANSLLWTQIKADVTGCSIAVPGADAVSALGAAMLAGVGAGVWASYGDAVRDVVRIARRHEPNRDNAAAYEEGYARYRALYSKA
ncbi:MAG: xylulokinase [Oscillospiraceae bacterium]|jgi:xylulokinase|nr:xylulokinase [Oscillospiraceae bacterium]